MTATMTSRAAYVALRRRSPSASVPAGAVRAHISELHEQHGLSFGAIAQRAGLGKSTVHDIAIGRKTSCRPETRSRILGVLGARPRYHISVVPDPEAEPVATPVGYPDPGSPPSFDDPLALFRLLFDPDVLAWKREGACARLDICVEDRQRWFFPTRGELVKHALAICADCTVRAPCAAFGVANDEQGVWGGTTGQDRRAIRRLLAADPDLDVADAITRVLG